MSNPRRVGRSVASLIAWIAAYLVLSAIVFETLPAAVPQFGELLSGYSTYVSIAFALMFGYMIVKAFSNVIYWSLRLKYPHQTSVAVKNLVKILGIGALAAGVAGGTAGGAAGVALGGFIGMVIGFATQRVLSQAVAGLFVLLARPIKIGDTVTVAGEKGVVKEITALFTIIEKEDGSTVLVPNNMVVGAKIYVHSGIKSSGKTS